MVLGLTILTSLVDRRFSAQSLELSLSEQRYRQLVESAQVILWRWSVDSSQFSFVNKEAEELLGYPAEQWLANGNFLFDHVHPDDRELTRIVLRRCRREPRFSTFRASDDMRRRERYLAEDLGSPGCGKRKGQRAGRSDDGHH